MESRISKILNFVKQYKWPLLSVFLWLLVWGTYNTDVYRFFLPGFPNNYFDLVHGFRSLLPFVAIIISFAIFVKLWKNSLLISPLGLFLLFTIVGIISSIFSENIMLSIYWGALYLVAIIVMIVVISSPYKKGISLIFYTNLFIAVFLSLFLVFIFLIKPGVFSLNTLRQFLEGFRPFEGIAGITVNEEMFGMSGTRPTGLGRYAAISAIMLFAYLWQKPNFKNIFYFITFPILTLVLIFSRARTSVIAFLCALFFIALFKVRSKFSFIFITGSIMLLLIFTNFYSYFWWYLVPESVPTVNKEIVSFNNSFTNGESPDSYINSESPDLYINGGFPDSHVNTLSGRTHAWHQAWNVFLSSPIIGRGFFTDRIFLQGQHVHNNWLHILIQSGLLGSFFFILAFLLSWIYLFYCLKKDSKNLILNSSIGIFVFFTIRSLTESFAFFGADFLFFIPIIAYIQLQARSNQNTNLVSNNQIQIAGKNVNLFDIKSVFSKISYWIKNERNKSHWIVLCGMHGVSEGYKDKSFMDKINSADISLPDGISLVVVGKLMGFAINKRIAGPDFMKESFELSEKNNYSLFFLGGSQETLENLVKKIRASHSKINIKGYYSPPFREFTQDDDKKMIDIINEKKPDILWVAFNLKKQEEWIFNNRHKIKVPVIIGVGAAFKFLSGEVKRAPKWLGDIGFEWLWRLIHEPKIIWKRVFVNGPLFIWSVILDLFNSKSYK